MNCGFNLQLMLLVPSCIFAQVHWAQWGGGPETLDPCENQKQDFCGILYKSLQIASLTPTSVHSKKSA